MHYDSGGVGLGSHCCSEWSREKHNVSFLGASGKAKFDTSLGQDVLGRGEVAVVRDAGWEGQVNWTISRRWALEKAVVRRVAGWALSAGGGGGGVMVLAGG